MARARQGLLRRIVQIRQKGGNRRVLCLTHSALVVERMQSRDTGMSTSPDRICSHWRSF